MALSLGEVNFGLGADTSGLNRAENDLRQFGRTVEETQRATSGMGQALRALSGAAALSQGPLSGVTSRITAVSGLFTRFGPLLAGAVVGVVSFGAALAGLTTLAVKSTTIVQRFDNTIVALTGSLIFAQEQFKFVQKTSQELGLDIEQTARSFAQLSASTANTALFGKDTETLFRSMSEAIAALQIPTQQAERAFIALSQMAAKGTVQMEELKNQLAEALPGSLQLMARALGVTSDKLFDMAKKGQLVAADVLPKFAEQLHTAFGPQAAQNLNTMTGAWNNMMNSVFELGVAFESQTHVVQALIALLNALAAALHWVASVFQAGADDVETQTNTLIKNTNDYIDRVKVLGGTYKYVKDTNVKAIEDQITALEKQYDANAALIKQAQEANKKTPEGGDMSAEMGLATPDSASVLNANVDEAIAANERI